MVVVVARLLRRGGGGAIPESLAFDVAPIPEKVFDCCPLRLMPVSVVTLCEYCERAVMQSSLVVLFSAITVKCVVSFRKPYWLLSMVRLRIDLIRLMWDELVPFLGRFLVW